MSKGSTLIELMVAFALLGIGGYLAGDAALSFRRQATEVAQRERALQCLEYEAEALLARSPVDPALRSKLLGELPEPMLDFRKQGPLTVLTVSWEGASRRRHTRPLAILREGR